MQHPVKSSLHESNMLLRKRLSKSYMLNLPQDSHKSKVKIAEKCIIIFTSWEMRKILKMACTNTQIDVFYILFHSVRN